MNPGKQTIEWLYREQLKVDDKWAVQTPNGFKWWADKQAQTIEVIGEEKGEDGDAADLVSVRTELLRDVEMSDRNAELINGMVMPIASMAGPVYDAKTGSLDLCSLVRVHGRISGWINPLISIAATLQIGEARMQAPALAKALGATEASSGHPTNGVRPTADEMANIIFPIVVPIGQEPSRWLDAEFQTAVDKWMQQPPALLASAGGPGLTVEFPYGEAISSLCRMWGNQPHPTYGNGLLQLLSFPVETLPDADGARLALSLNTKELTEKPWGYGFGSYAFRDGTLHFTSFWPNLAYKPGLLQNLYYGSAQRARTVSLLLTGRDWDADSFSILRTAVGRAAATKPARKATKRKGAAAKPRKASKAKTKST